jgi:hypothetical protein
LEKGAAAGGAAGGGAGAATPVTFVATPAMVNHQDLINYTIKVGTMIYNEGCEKLTTEFDMKLSGTIVYITECQAKYIKMGDTLAPRRSSTLPMPQALPSTWSTSTARLMQSCSRPNVRSSAKALEHCSKQEPSKITQ